VTEPTPPPSGGNPDSASGDKLGEATIHRHIDRENDLLVMRGDFASLFAAYLDHVRRWESEPDGLSQTFMRQGLGAAILHLESLESAQARGARIYAEVMGGALNCGGHRSGGSMTAPNPVSVRRCIGQAVADAEIDPREIDLINGHLTATGADANEVAAWAEALGATPDTFPVIHSTKSLIGHGLGAAGALESVACVLMLRGRFAHPSLNCEDVHPMVEAYAGSIPHETREMPGLRTVIKSGFGFGDVNACVIFRRWAD